MDDLIADRGQTIIEEHGASAPNVAVELDRLPRVTPVDPACRAAAVTRPVPVDAGVVEASTVAEVFSYCPHDYLRGLKMGRGLSYHRPRSAHASRWACAWRDGCSSSRGVPSIST